MRKINVTALIILLVLLLNCGGNTYKQGKILYENFCENCHMADGSGLAGLIPPLANADYIKDNPLIMTCIIRNGMEGEIVVNGVTYDQPMEAIRELSDFEIANVINYINHAWGNDYGTVKLEDIRKELNNCP